MDSQPYERLRSTKVHEFGIPGWRDHRLVVKDGGQLILQAWRDGELHTILEGDRMTVLAALEGLRASVAELTRT